MSAVFCDWLTQLLLMFCQVQGGAQAALAVEQPMEEPPLLQFQVRVVPQAVAPLSLDDEPVLQAPLLPQTGQATLPYEQVPELEPPLAPLQTQVRVWPQEVWPLSLPAEPDEQPSGVLLLQAPLTGQAA